MVRPFCRGCKIVLPDESHFCFQCGDRLNALSTPVSVNPVAVMPENSPAPTFVDFAPAPKSASVRGGERKLVTVVFADINGFTSLSEKLDPERVTDIMNQLFRRLGRVVQEQEGTIDKFMGDCIMALFGAPIAHENDPELAVLCGLKMQECLKEFNQDTGLCLSLSIGINSGMVIAGGVGAEGKMDYTVMGDAVNVAQRLQSAADKGQILVSRSVQTYCESAFEFQTTQPIEMKGKEKPYEAFILKGRKKSESSKEKSQLPPLIGRDAELLLMDRLLDEASAGRGQILFMTGEAGIGKSRLRLELKRRAEEKNFRFFEAKCSSITRSTAYASLIQLLKGIFKLDNHDSHAKQLEQMSDLSAWGLGQASEVLLRDLLQLNLPDDEPIRLDGAARKNLLAKTIKAICAKITLLQPTVIHFEDIHWVDPMSRDVLSLFIDSAPKWPLFVSCGLRPDFTHDWGRKRNYHQISLGPLTLNQSLQIVGSLLQISEVPKPLQILIEQKSDGNPLYISEIVKSLVESGKIQKREGEIVLAQDLDAVEIPATVQGLIAARIDRLNDAEKSFLQMASIVGRRFDRALMEKLIDDPENVESLIESLRQKELVYEAKSESSDALYSFNHALTQDVAYQGILVKVRKSYHLKVGLALEAESTIENIETLAYHFEEANEPLKAIHYQILSGQRAAANFENAGAILFFQKAIKGLETLPERTPAQDQSLIELKTQLAQVFSHIGDHANSNTLQKQIIDIAEGKKDLSLLARGYRYLADSARKRGNSEESLKNLEDSLKSAVEGNDYEAQVRAWKSLGSTFRQLSQLDKALEILNKGLAGAQSLANRQLEAEFFNDIATVLLDLARLDEARSRLEESIKISSEIKSLKPLFVSSTNNLGCVLQGKDDLQGALDKFRSTARAAKEIGDIKNTVIAQNNTAEILIEFERFEEALIELSESRQQSQDAGFSYFQISAQIMMAYCQMRTGKESQGLKSLQEMKIEAASKKFLALEADAMIYEARHFARVGEPDRALEILEKGCQMALDAKNLLTVNRFEAEKKKLIRTVGPETLVPRSKG